MDFKTQTRPCEQAHSHKKVWHFGDIPHGEKSCITDLLTGRKCNWGDRLKSNCEEIVH